MEQRPSIPERNTVYDVTLKFDFTDLCPEDEYYSEFPENVGNITYSSYWSKNREATLIHQLAVLEERLKRRGWHHGEIVRAYVERVREGVLNKP
jgi:hypothetical protein